MTKYIDHECYGKKTLCTCPKCRKKHTTKMRWIGRGTPWVFCQPCKRECDDYEHIEDQGSAPWYALKSTIGLS